VVENFWNWVAYFSAVDKYLLPPPPSIDIKK
jgi:hypothetical protein